MQYHLIATSTFGLEAVVRREIQALGYEVMDTENGKVTFAGDDHAIARANLWLRSADRVLIKLDEFVASTSEDLFQRVQGYAWEDYIPMDGKVVVTCSTVRSTLRSEPNNQKTVKKAIALRLCDYYGQESLPETGARYPVKITLLKDRATLTLDTTGEGLHKRGYRKKQTAAPLKETLAAAMIQLSFWKPGRLLVDPVCGSGTIPIEAAMIARNIAPGLTRRFLCEDWNWFGEATGLPQESKWQGMWREERNRAYEGIRQDPGAAEQFDAGGIFGMDIDPAAIEIARANAENAGVAEDIHFTVADTAKLAKALPARQPAGIVIANPPYGQRIGEEKTITHLLAGWHDFFAGQPTWSLFVLMPPEPGIEERIMGRSADRRRKLYNGRMEVCYYQFHGEKVR